MRINLKGIAYSEIFNEIHTPFALFDFSDPGVVYIQPLSKIAHCDGFFCVNVSSATP